MPNPASWLRAINKSGEDAQTGLALFIYAPVETSKARVCRWMVRFRDMLTRQRNSDRKSRKGWIIHDERVGDAKRFETSVLVVATKAVRKGPDDRRLLASWAILLRVYVTFCLWTEAKRIVHNVA
jgi:hypothetical protein